MTLRLCDGYDWLPTSGSISNQLQAAGFYGGVANAGTISSGLPFVTNPGNALSFGTAFGGNTIYRALPSRYTTKCFFGRRVYMTANDVAVFGFYDTQLSGGAVLCYVSLNPAGAITLHSASGTVLAATYAGVWYSQRWFYLEMAIQAGATGVFEVRVNTRTVLSLPVVNITNGTPALGQSPGFDVIFAANTTGYGSSWNPFYEDDFYFCDDQGSINNTFLGNARVPAQLATGNSTPLNWTIGGSSPAATNWQSVLNTALDDTKFNYTSTVSNRDLYTLQAIINSPNIYGIQVSSALRQDDATQRAARNTIKSGSTSAEGVDHYTDQTYRLYNDIWEINPATSVGFTGAELNALLGGPKLTV